MFFLFVYNSQGVLTVRVHRKIGLFQLHPEYILRVPSIEVNSIETKVL